MWRMRQYRLVPTINEIIGRLLNTGGSAMPKMRGERNIYDIQKRPVSNCVKKPIQDIWFKTTYSLNDSP